MRRGHGGRWLLSGCVGFLSFLAYVGYGYLDTWHGIATLLLVPLFVVGLWRSRGLVIGPLDVRSVLRPGDWLVRRDRVGLGRAVLLLGAVATLAGGAAILRIGVGDTFVPEDLDFIGLSADEIRAIDPRLVPLLAHDRAGFGGGLVTLGLTAAMCLWCGGVSRNLHTSVALSGMVSLGLAIGVHVPVGYTDWWHLTPPLIAATLLVVGLVLAWPPPARAATARTAPAAG